MSDETKEREAEAAFRHRAVENCRRAHAVSDVPRCDCWQFNTCVKCAYWLGVAEGQVQAGAYLTHEEVFADLRKSGKT